MLFYPLVSIVLLKNLFLKLSKNGKVWIVTLRTYSILLRHTMIKKNEKEKEKKKRKKGKEKVFVIVNYQHFM